MSRRRGAALACALVVVALAGAVHTASGDSFTPVRMQVSISALARLHGRLPVTITVTADPGVLDSRTARLRVRVKLAAECGGEFSHTAGTVLLDRRLNPQPDPGEPYQASATGSGKPTAYGAQTVCVFLQDENALQFATDTESQVSVTRQCTAGATRYDAAAGALARARAELRSAHSAESRKRLQKLVAKRRAVSDAARRGARSTCGPVLPL